MGSCPASSSRRKRTIRWRPCCRGCCRAQRVSGAARVRRHVPARVLFRKEAGAGAALLFAAGLCALHACVLTCPHCQLGPAAPAAAPAAAGNWETDSSEALAQDLLSRAKAKADAEYFAALSGDFSEEDGADDEEEDGEGSRTAAAGRVRSSSDEDDEEAEGSGVEDEEEEGAAAARLAG